MPAIVMHAFSQPVKQDFEHEQVVKARVLDAKQTALEKKVSWLLLLQWGTLLLAAATGGLLCCQK